MKKTNLYWPVYKNLEKEVIDLSFNVYFDDMQFEYILDKTDGEKYVKTPPYSIKIGDLLIRCCIEIEALTKEMTRCREDDIKKMLTFDKKKGITIAGRALYLKNLWDLDKKIIYVSSPNMFFQKEENLAFAPFCYKAEDNDDFISAYNAIKHNRNKKTIYKGNIRFLLRAMAVLFLLNVYFKDEDVSLGGRAFNNYIQFDENCGSNLFSLRVFRADNFYYMKNYLSETPVAYKELPKCTYIIKYSKESFNRISEVYCREMEKCMTQFNKAINDFLEKNPKFTYASKKDLHNEVLANNEKLQKHLELVVDNSIQTANRATSHATLNKGQDIYPKVDY